MHIITRRRLLEFGVRHPDAAQPLDEWYRRMKRRNFTAAHQLHDAFAYVSFVGGRIAVFNVCGNRYRLVAGMDYQARTVYVRHIVAHHEYDRLNAEGTL